MNANPNSPAEQIVGYDARDFRNDFASLWPPLRREQFLYRLDVEKVLSVDHKVWPSIFTLIGAPPPHQTAMQDLWADRSSLHTTLARAAQQKPLPPYCSIGITLVDDGSAKDHPTSGHLTGLVSPSTFLPDWKLVGYDVADAWLLSALANCGFLPGMDDVFTLRSQWAPLLNQFHLFSDLASATAFRLMSNQRLASDHAPTFVYGIHVLT